MSYEVRFKGYVVKTVDSSGDPAYEWKDGEKVMAVAYDYPVPGYKTNNCINIRLWSSKPCKLFDFESFNDGNYEKSVADQV